MDFNVISKDDLSAELRNAMHDTKYQEMINTGKVDMFLKNVKVNFGGEEVKKLVAYQPFCDKIIMPRLRKLDIMYFSNNDFLYELNIGPNVTELPSACFFGDKFLEKLTFDSGININAIPSRCFEDCVRLKSIKIPKGVTRIRNRAFYHCVSLENVYIPNTVEFIELDAFSESNKVNIYFESRKDESGKLLQGCKTIQISPSNLDFMNEHSHPASEMPVEE